MGTLQKLFGSWELESFVIEYDDGSREYPLGEDAQGLIIYTREGIFAGQMMARGRPKFPRNSAAEKDSGSDAQVRAAFDGYVAYYCKFELDEARGIVNHHVIAGLLPDWEGRLNVRHYAFEGDDRLILRAPHMLINGKPGRNKLVWRRLPAVF